MAAVGNLRAIRRKIRSVDNLKKITRAMQMVSASKLRKTQGKLMQIRPYADKIKSLLENLASRESGHSLFIQREQVNNILFVVITSDKGLCGTYNSNMIKESMKQVQGKSSRIIAIGRKAIDFYSRHQFKIELTVSGLPTDVSSSRVQQINREILSMYESGKVDEVYISYTKFINALNFKPITVKFLPIEKTGKAGTDYIFEPEPKKMLDVLIPRYLTTTLHRYILESLSSEHAARMNAMKNATDNAEEMVYSLTLIRNRVRQAAITKELLDIVTGTESLKAR